MNKRKGFTLIELLVVISIIALLVSILMPALGKAREQTKFAVCKTNLKSYGVLATMYADDNNGVMPNPWMCFYNSHEEYPGEPHRYCRWHNPDFDLNLYPQYAGPFWKYLKTKDIHLCPTFLNVARKKGDQHPSHAPGIPIKPNYSYSMNAYLYEKKISAIKRHAEVFFFGEENLWITPPYNSYAFNDTAFWAYHDPAWDSFGTFHNARKPDMEDGVVNAVFIDGHVEEVTRLDTWRLSAPDGYKMTPEAVKNMQK